MISSSQKLLIARNTFIRQARFMQSSSAAASDPAVRFQLKTKPQALDHKLWKNALEVRILTLSSVISVKPEKLEVTMTSYILMYT